MGKMGIYMTEAHIVGEDTALAIVRSQPHAAVEDKLDALQTREEFK